MHVTPPNPSPVDKLLAARQKPAPATTGQPTSNSPAVATARRLLDQYNALKGRPRAAFFNARYTDLVAAGDLVTNADNPPASSEQFDPGDIASARNLMAKYSGLQGREKAEFGRVHGKELNAAASLIGKAHQH